MMTPEANKILIDSIKRLLRRGAVTNLKKIVERTHAADLSVVFRSLPKSDQRRLFQMIPQNDKKGWLFSELETDIFLNLAEGLKIEDMAAIFETMATDDVADLLGRLPEETSDAILKSMKKEGSAEVEGLMVYDDDTAGGIMLPDFIAVTENSTAQQAIASLQKEHMDVEMPFYLYVVDEYSKLVGVSSLRQLVVVPPDTPVKEFMTTDVFSVRTDTDQEEVAKLVEHYDLLAVPVVDHSHRLVGIVTVDDIIDILRREATEDILRMAGAGEEFVETKSIFRSTRIRLPWLFASCIGGIVAFFIIQNFENSLSKVVYLAAFIPVIMGMGGNIGTQSSTIVVRGLATGRLHIGDIWSVVAKELAIGFILGLIYGTLIGSVARFRFDINMLALAVGLSVVFSMAIAALVGSLIPMAFARINIDPAVATGPFVTTAMDIISVFAYFLIATTFLGI